MRPETIGLEISLKVEKCGKLWGADDFYFMHTHYFTITPMTGGSGKGATKI
jgi:hypothetical protein